MPTLTNLPNKILARTSGSTTRARRRVSRFFDILFTRYRRDRAQLTPTPLKNSIRPAHKRALFLPTDAYKPNQSSSYSLYLKALYRFLIHTPNINFVYLYVFQSAQAYQNQGFGHFGIPTIRQRNTVSGTRIGTRRGAPTYALKDSKPALPGKEYKHAKHF